MIGMIGAIVFVLIGLPMAIFGGGLAGAILMLIGAGIAVYNGINVFTDRGIAAEIVDFETDSDDGDGGLQESPVSVEERLAQLESIRKRGMITDQEYRKQRERILSDL